MTTVSCARRIRWLTVTRLAGGARQIKDALGNEYARPKDIVGEVRHTFTSPANTAFDVCFDNILVGRGMSYSSINLVRCLVFAPA